MGECIDRKIVEGGDFVDLGYLGIISYSERLVYMRGGRKEKNFWLDGESYSWKKYWFDFWKRFFFRFRNDFGSRLFFKVLG